MIRNSNVIAYICQCRNNMRHHRYVAIAYNPENEGYVYTTGEALGVQNKASRRMLNIWKPHR